MGVSADSCKGAGMGGVSLLLLVPDRVAVFFPHQQLDPVGGFVAEHEEDGNRSPLSWQALPRPLQRRLRSPTPGRCSNWPAGATVKEARIPKEAHHAPIPSRPRPPPRRTNPRPWAPSWLELPDDQRLQLLRVLGRMLTDRLSDDETAGEEGDHEPH
jgi:hypothetical protein